MDPKTVSNIFNDFFINVGKKLADKFSKVGNNEALNVNNNVYFDN